MSEFALLTFVAAVIVHLVLRRTVVTVVILPIVMGVLLQSVGCLRDGYLDPFFFIGFWVSVAVGVPVSAAAAGVVSLAKPKPRDEER
jgi:ABC-type transport system involved in cytochrome c biogenesis permease component